MNADKFTINICAYKDYIICTVNNTPKVIKTGIGSVLANFNKNDVEISQDAITILRSCMINPVQFKENIGLKIHSKTKISWASASNIIVHKNDVAVYDIPTHKLVENIVDSKIKEDLNKL